VKRRQFIAASVHAALGVRAAALLGGAISSAALAAASLQVFDNRETRSLMALTRAMFPHSELDDAYYLEVIEYLDSRAAGSGELLGLIRAGISELDEAAGGSWVDSDVDRKLQVLEALQTEAFFGAILNSTIDVLYRNQAVLDYLGYPGSSIEYGGYIKRGFDDIGWLPE